MLGQAHILVKPCREGDQDQPGQDRGCSKLAGLLGKDEGQPHGGAVDRKCQKLFQAKHPGPGLRQETAQARAESDRQVGERHPESHRFEDRE